MAHWQILDQPTSLDQLIEEKVLGAYDVYGAQVSKRSLQAFRRREGCIQMWFLFGGCSSPQIGYAMFDSFDGGGLTGRIRRRWHYAVVDVATDTPGIADCPGLYVQKALPAGNLDGEFAPARPSLSVPLPYHPPSVDSG